MGSGRVSEHDQVRIDRALRILSIPGDPTDVVEVMVKLDELYDAIRGIQSTDFDGSILIENALWYKVHDLKEKWGIV